MSKHTPGPWIVRAIDGSIGSIDAADGIQMVAQAMEIGHQDRTTGSPERIANARLIAAAPELLAALKAMFNEHGEFEYSVADLIFARDAIAKAEGKQ